VANRIPHRSDAPDTRSTCGCNDSCFDDWSTSFLSHTLSMLSGRTADLGRNRVERGDPRSHAACNWRFRQRGTGRNRVACKPSKTLSRCHHRTAAMRRRRIAHAALVAAAAGWRSSRGASWRRQEYSCPTWCRVRGRSRPVEFPGSGLSATTARFFSIDQRQRRTHAPRDQLDPLRRSGPMTSLITAPYAIVLLSLGCAFSMPTHPRACTRHRKVVSGLRSCDDPAAQFKASGYPGRRMRKETYHGTSSSPIPLHHTSDTGRCRVPSSSCCLGRGFASSARSLRKVPAHWR